VFRACFDDNFLLRDARERKVTIATDYMLLDGTLEGIP